MKQLSEWLMRPVDLASLVLFRVFFGAVILWEVLRYFSKGWISSYYMEPDFHFKYYGFGWVQAWPGDGMQAHFLALGVLAMLVIVGLYYRLASALLFLGLTYVFLLDQTRYLNHFYLICLVSFLMILMPAHRMGSLDARRRPGLYAETAPAWSLYLMRFQIGIVYFYGGLAKLNADWLAGKPMDMWLHSRRDFALLGPWFATESSALFFSYGGLLLDLGIVPLLLWRRTRLIACIVVCSFHLMNAWLFTIGIFPWFMILATTLFFEPDWPRRMRLLMPRSSGATKALSPEPDGLKRRLLFAGLAGYLAFQLLVPLRHHLYPGRVDWNEEGHRFSWRMKLRDKDSHAEFYTQLEPGGELVALPVRDVLTRKQIRKMAGRPDMLLQLAHHFAEHWSPADGQPIPVFAHVFVELNGRRRKRFIDPAINLAQVQRSLAHAPWIVPFEERQP